MSKTKERDSFLSFFDLSGTCLPACPGIPNPSSEGSKKDMNELSIYLSEDLEWTERAECRDIQPSDVFFDISNPEYIRLAKSICRMCTVQKACLEYSIETEQKDGIWGGLLPKERRRRQP